MKGRSTQRPGDSRVKLSVLVPVYNERYLLPLVVERVLSAELPEGIDDREVLLVDDGSTDGSTEIVRELVRDHADRIRAFFHDKNRGKGAALRTALEAATGEYCIVQDADLEYRPEDYPRLLRSLLAGEADVVYGSRFTPAASRRVLYYWHTVGNRLLTQLSNMLTNLNLTDMETCFKAFRTQLLKTIPLRSNDFRIEPEITAKIAKRGFRVFEVPISYYGRTYNEGKKTRWWDGILAVQCMLKYALIDDLYEERSGHEILGNLSRAHRFNRWMADTIRPYLGDRVLELGAGIGNLTTLLLPRDRYVATDVDDLYLDVLGNLALRRMGLDVARLDATHPKDYQRFAGEVDTVVCLNVLEHIEEASTVLRCIRDTLVEEGNLILLVPQGKWLFSPIDEALDHVKRYSKAELGKLLALSGFDQVKLFDFNRAGIFGWGLNGKLLRRRTIPRFQLKLYDANVWLWRALEKVLPVPGLSLVAVARKRGR